MNHEIPNCALCGSGDVREFCRDKSRDFYQCEECRLVFVPPCQFPSPEEERARYDLHQNSPGNADYRRHLSRLFIPVHQSLNPGSSGLDFGSGPEPALSLLFSEAGHFMTLFDCYYNLDPTALEREYDFITASEVVEHLHDPGRELDRLWACLKPGGKLGIMTRPVVEQAGFSEWHYKNDRTHVCFFSAVTFGWLARRWEADLSFVDSDVILFHKKQFGQNQGKSIVRKDEQSRDLQSSGSCGGNALQSAGGRVIKGSLRLPLEGTPLKTLPVLYQDKYLIAVNKPAGLLVHRSEIDPLETIHAMKILRNQLGQWVYPFHRLDKATSGVLVFGLDQETARRMTTLFTEDKVSKRYLAIVRGYTGDGERIDYALRDRCEIRKHRNAGNENQGKQSVTEYKRLATVEVEKPVGRYSTARYSLLDVKPVTGRMHQIRRHMKHIFHPIIGDTTYGDGKQNLFFRQHFNCHRLLLHAHRIDFPHPCNGQQLIIDAPLDEDFNALLKVFQLPSL